MKKNKMQQKIQNRIKSRAGMSLGEVLVTVLLILLTTGVVTATVSLGVRHYLASLSASEANTLASTLESLMTDELAYTSEIHVDDSGNVTKYQSQHYTAASSLSMIKADGATGKVMITYPDDASKADDKLLADKSYPNNLQVSIDKCVYDTPTADPKTCTFTITISIKRNSETILTRTFNIINLNKTIPTT